MQSSSPPRPPSPTGSYMEMVAPFPNANAQVSEVSINEQQRYKPKHPLDVLVLVKAEDVHHPKRWPLLKRWLIVIVYCLLQLFVTILSTSYVSAQFAIALKYGGSKQVRTLGQSLFMIGNALGPIVMGPLSDFAGRKHLYVLSTGAFAVMNVGCAYAPNLATLIACMFLAGIAGSTSLTNVAGTIADLFADYDIAGQAMALFVVSANCGPSLGSPIGAWIADYPNLGLKWVFLINVIVGMVFAVVMCFIPETLPRIVIARGIASTGNVNSEELRMLSTRVSLYNELKYLVTMTGRMIIFEPIILTLGLFNGFAFGIMFLYLDGVYDVFAVNNGLSPIHADLTYLNFVVGVLIMFCVFTPIQTHLYTKDRLKNRGINRPEARFLTSLFTVWGFPMSLFWFAYSSNGNTSYWSPVIAGAILGIVDPLLWLGMLNFITDSYPNVAASAIAAFMIPSFVVAAALSHLGIVMFERNSTQKAMSIIGCVSLGLCVLIYIIYFFGKRLRALSPLARNY